MNAECRLFWLFTKEKMGIRACLKSTFSERWIVLNCNVVYSQWNSPQNVRN